MIFPEIRSRLKEWLPDFGGAPLSLNLKEAGVAFTPSDLDAAFYRKYPGIVAALSGGFPAWSGETVNIDTALTNSIVWACKKIISEMIGASPAFFMQTVGNQKRIATEHPAYRAMKNAPNDEMTAQTFKETLTGHCLLRGGGFAKIHRRSGTGVAYEFEPLLPQQIQIDKEKQGQKRLVYSILNERGTTDKTYTVERGKPQDILHIRGLGWDGIRGYDVITYARQSIGTAIAAEKHAATFWAKGGRIPYAIKFAPGFKFRTETEFDEWKTNWDKVANRPNEAPLLENGADIAKLGLSMVESQALESRLAAAAEIARWFSISPYLVNDLSHATFANVEQLWLQFKMLTLSTWIKRWEDNFWLCVLTPDEKSAGYYLHHNVDALLRADFQTRMAGYASALQNGHMSVDEVRELEDRNPLPDGAGADHHIQLNLQPLPADQKPGLVKLGGKSKKELVYD